MLLELFKFLAKEIHGFNVFNYITLRAVMATRSEEHTSELQSH